MTEERKDDVILEIKDLVVQFTSDKDIVHALNNISLKLKRGQTLGLVGETGAGKTTIAKSILRILPERQTRIPQGEIIFEGIKLTNLSEKEMQKIRGNKISMIFQDPMTALNPTQVVGKQIAEAIELHENCDRKESYKRAGKMLEMVGIPAARFGEYPHQFSGGMKQRVVIAMALACNPDILLADEPTTALDVTIQAQVLDMIDDLKKKNNTSMILITHDLGIVAGACNDVAVIYAGEIIEFGTTEEIFDHPSHPYTLGLFGSLPDMNGTEKRLKPIAGMMPDPTNLPEGCKFSPRCPWATEECKKKNPDAEYLGGTHIVKCFRKGDVKHE